MHRILIAILATAAFATAAAQTLTVWVWDINKPALESTIASFQEMHPGVEVVVEDLGNQNVYDRGLAGCAAGGFDLPGTVMPFILRGVRLQGIDSVMAPVPLRKLAWERLASELDLDLLHSMTTEVALSDLLNVAPKILAGQIRGRSIVNTHA